MAYLTRTSNSNFRHRRINCRAAAKTTKSHLGPDRLMRLSAHAVTRSDASCSSCPAWAQRLLQIRAQVDAAETQLGSAAHETSWSPAPPFEPQASVRIGSVKVAFSTVDVASCSWCMFDLEMPAFNKGASMMPLSPVTTIDTSGYSRDNLNASRGLSSLPPPSTMITSGFHGNFCSSGLGQLPQPIHHNKQEPSRHETTARRTTALRRKILIIIRSLPLTE